MPLENSGKTIIAIKALKKSVAIVFDDETLKISHDRYTDHYLYIGKTLPLQEYSSLQDEATIFILENYAYRLLSRGLYTEKQIRDKLYTRGAKRWMVETIIEHLNKANLINDEEYMNERIEYGHTRLEGYHAIYQELRIKGISETLLLKFKMDPKIELDKAKQMLPRLQKRHTRKSSLAQHKSYSEWFITHGYERNIIAPLLDDLSEYDQKREIENLDREFEIGLRKYGHKYKGRKLRERLFQYLASKGYNYQHIKLKLGDLDNEMD